MASRKSAYSSGRLDTKQFERFLAIVGNSMSDGSTTLRLSRSSADMFLKRVRKNTPVNTGALKSTASIVRIDAKTVFVGWDSRKKPRTAQYAPFVEKRKRPIARAYAQTYRKALPQIERDANQEFSKAVIKAARKTGFKVK